MLVSGNTRWSIGGLACALALWDSPRTVEAWARGATRCGIGSRSVKRPRFDAASL